MKLIPTKYGKYLVAYRSLNRWFTRQFDTKELAIAFMDYLARRYNEA